MDGKLGFEPRLTESESVVLPLNYSPMNYYISSLLFTSATQGLTDFVVTVVLCIVALGLNVSFLSDSILNLLEDTGCCE